MSVSQTELKVGIVGAGGFASFASQAFLKVPGVRVVAVYDIYDQACKKMSLELLARPYTDYESFLQDENIDLVYIASPPFLHYAQSKAALYAGKHVICEKPAAIHTAEAEELVEYARSKDLLYVVDLMQRYNPLTLMVDKMVKNKLLGEFLHGFFENYASDQKLIPEHWFWNEEISGGIFIEHGVHFFDLFSGWLGKGEVIHSAIWQRQGVDRGIIDRVQTIVNYPDGPVNFYHGFDQPKILDRQEMRLQFERGDITLYEWVPVKIRIHGLFNNAQIEQLRADFPGCSITDYIKEDPDSDYSGLVEVTTPPETINTEVTGRFKPIVYDRLITLQYGIISDKKARYEQLLTSMIKDQWNWILDHSAGRVIDDTNAVESLRVAEKATKKAERY